MNPYLNQSLPSVLSINSFPNFSSIYKLSNYNDSRSTLEKFSDYIGSYTTDFFEVFDLNNISVEEEANPIGQVLREEAYSFDIERFARKFLDALFHEAKIRLSRRKSSLNNFPLFGDSNNNLNSAANSRSAFTDFLGEFTPSSSTSSAFEDWPKISEFNIKLGLERLESYVSQWQRSDDWVFCVEFLGFECEDCANIFVFEVEWSKPTVSYPIPQATASVFFGLEVFKMLPYNYDRIVDVTYIFECSNVIHKPGRIDFQEKWLQDILDAKLKFFKSITFAVPKGICEEQDNEIQKDNYIKKLKQSFK